MKAIEFYTTPEGEVTMRPIGEAERQLKETDTDFIQAFLAILREFYPEAYDALMDIYSKNSNNKRYRDFIAVRRFIKCNFGLYDNMIDVDENWNFNFEFVGCPLRGECKHDKVICAPKFNSKLSDRQIEVMRMLYDGKNDSEIAEKLFISLNTVNNHRKNSFRKVGVHSMAEFMRYAMTNKSFQITNATPMKGETLANLIQCGVTLLLGIIALAGALFCNASFHFFTTMACFWLAWVFYTDNEYGIVSVREYFKNRYKKD